MADLADDVDILADDADLLVLAEAHFAEPMGNFRRGGELLDANGGASLDAVQWAEARLLEGVRRSACWLSIVHATQARSVETELQDGSGLGGRGV